MKILVLNSWSSSLKFSLFEMPSEKVLLEWNFEKIWFEDSFCTFKIKDNNKIEKKEVSNHKEALEFIFSQLFSKKYNLSDIDLVWHRVVHGWEYFDKPVIINDDILEKLDSLVDLAPLHNPINISVINYMREILPHTKQIAVFDTSFHQTISKENYLYALPYEYYEKYKIRKYWFHGTSHNYLNSRALEIIKLDKKDSKIITCHIWSGASICAIKDGKSIDTSMWFTPLDWLIMWTRSGDIDAGIISYLSKKESIDLKTIDEILNKKSWVLWLSWKSPDLRDIEKWYLENDEKSILIMEMYVNRIVKYIAWYIALLDGIDILIFSGWVLEKSKIIRKKIIDKLSFFDIKIDTEKNETHDKESIISLDNSKIKVIVLNTKEDLMIARESYFV